MSSENLQNNSGNNTSTINFGHIHQLLEKFNETENFKKKIAENQAWMNSVNPTAVLITKIQMLYDDCVSQYLYWNAENDDSDSSDDEEGVYDKFHKRSHAASAKKLLRLIFKWIDAAHKPWWGKEDIPKVLKILNDCFGEAQIEKLYSEYRVSQKQKITEDISDLVCIDETLEKESKSFIKFVGKAKNVYVSTNQKKIKEFLKALQKPDFYQDEIFKDKKVLYYALAACRHGDITPEQYASLSQWIELKKYYGEEKIKVHRLLIILPKN